MGKPISILLCLSALAVIFIRSYDNHNKTPFVLFKQLRIGSHLKDLQNVFSDEQLNRSVVITNCSPSETCIVKDIGNLYNSRILDSEHQFSGKIFVFFERPFLSKSVALSLEFSNGVLTGKDWGFLPG